MNNRQREEADKAKYELLDLIGELSDEDTIEIFDLDVRDYAKELVENSEMPLSETLEKIKEIKAIIE